MPREDPGKELLDPGRQGGEPAGSEGGRVEAPPTSLAGEATTVLTAIWDTPGLPGYPGPSPVGSTWGSEA